MERVAVENLLDSPKVKEGKAVIITVDNKDIGIFCNMSNARLFKDRNKISIQELKKFINSILIEIINTKNDFGTNTIFNNIKFDTITFDKNEGYNVLSALIEQYTHKNFIKRIFRGQYKVIQRITPTKIKISHEDIKYIEQGIEDYIKCKISGEDSILVNSKDLIHEITCWLYNKDIDLYNLVVNTDKIKKIISKYHKQHGNKHWHNGIYTINSLGA